MSAPNLDRAIADILSDRRLLDHPFYQRWERGEVTISELRSYAVEYRHFETYLPDFLTGLVADLPDGSARDLVAANLADEQGDPIAHVELFERFAAAVGAGSAAGVASVADARSPAMHSLISTYEQLLNEGAVAALAGFFAYEFQASDVARRKADGLCRHYGFDEHAVSFWEHHATTDIRHAAWVHHAITESTAPPEQLAPFIRQAADAWWAFLDEREVVSPAC